jgi:hypothetical protein
MRSAHLFTVSVEQDEFTKKELPGRLAYQPPAARAALPFDGTTTYKDTFHAHAISPRKAMGPPPQACAPTRCDQAVVDLFRLSAPLDGACDCTFAHALLLHPHRWCFNRCWHGNPRADDSGRFDAQTSYASDYPGHQPGPRMPLPPMPARAQVKFEGTTSYHDEFPAKVAEPRAMGTTSVQERPRVPFDATTEYQTTYHAHDLPSRMAYQAPPARARVPFDGTTTNQHTYVQHPIDPRCRFALGCLCGAEGRHCLHLGALHLLWSRLHPHRGLKVVRRNVGVTSAQAGGKALQSSRQEKLLRSQPC